MNSTLVPAPISPVEDIVAELRAGRITGEVPREPPPGSR